MDRLLILLIALAGIGALGLAWRGMKLGLRHSIQVDPEILEDERPALLYFSSVDCAPCRLYQAPILDRLRQALGNSVRFQEYDAVENPELASRYRVLTVPTTLVIAPGGEVVAVNYGLAQADKLQRQLLEAGARLEAPDFVGHACSVTS
jgi:thioredoxin 1